VELYLTDDAEANALLAASPFALLLGMLLDQQIPMERAFRGPALLRERLAALGYGDDPCTLAGLPIEDLVEVVSAKPALHRFPASMAKRIQALAGTICEQYGGRTEAIWEGVDAASTLLDRLQALPGFGSEKARIFLALLAKRFGVKPDGWETASAPFGEPGVYRSVADATSPEALERIRETKAAVKAERTARSR
jgi:uncharacterized HhH-GPD family protein